jgi:hypothetical protein
MLIYTLSIHYIILLFRVCVCPLIDSAAGHHTDVGPESLEPVWTQRGTLGKKFAESWLVAKIE